MGSSLSTRNRRLQRGPTRGPRRADPPTVIGGAAVDYTLFLAVLAMLGASLVLARAVNYGPGLHADSFSYINTAQTLLAGKGFFVNALDAPYTLWPPLYPLALAAAAGLSGFDPLEVAGPLNAAFFGLTVFLLGRWLRRRLESRFLAAWTACALALSIPLSDAAAWALSEPLFMLLAMAALIRTDAFLTEGKTRSLAAAAAYGALAFQARYIGVVVPFWVGLLLLCRAGGGPRRAKQAAAVWFAAGLPMALWLLRNFLRTGELAEVTGERFPGGDYPLPLILRQAGGILRGWADFDLPWAAVAAAALGAVAAAVAGWRAASPCGAVSPARLARPAGGLLLLFGGFALTYLILFAAAMASGGAANQVRPRFLAPLYIPLLTTAAVALDRLVRAGRGGGPKRRAASRLAAAAVAAALCLWTTGQAAAYARRIVRASAGEQGGRPRPVESAVRRYVREHPLDGVIYTNQLRLPLAIRNRRPAAYYRLPSDAERNALLYLGDAAAPAGAGQELVRARLAAAPHGAYWVRFEDGAYTDNLLGFGDAWLQTMPMLETVADLADGAIYRVRKNAPPRANPYRAALRAAVAGQRVGESRVGGPGFDVSIRGGELVYIKEECTTQEARMRFMLHVYPADAADLPAARKSGGYAFDNLSFYFTEHGIVLEGACVALNPLPDYAIERIETGQYAPGGEGLAWRAALRAAVGGSASR